MSQRRAPDDGLPRKGIGYWPFWKLYLFMFAMVNGAVSVNTAVIWSASRVYGHFFFDFWDIMAVMFPLTILGAYFMVVWVRSLVRDADGTQPHRGSRW